MARPFVVDGEAVKGYVLRKARKTYMCDTVGADELIRGWNPGHCEIFIRPGDEYLALDVPPGVYSSWKDAMPEDAVLGKRFCTRCATRLWTQEGL